MYYSRSLGNWASAEKHVQTIVDNSRGVTERVRDPIPIYPRVTVVRRTEGSMASTGVNTPPMSIPRAKPARISPSPSRVRRFVP